MARRSDSGRKKSLHNLSPTVTTTNGNRAVLTGSKCQSCGSQTHQRNDCWYKDETCKTCGKRRHLAKVCRRGNAQTPRNGSPKGTGKGSGMCLERGRTQESRSKFRTATCSNCGKVGHLRAVCRNTNTHEIRKDADEPSPEVTVEEVWCVAFQDAVDDGHCDCTKNHDVVSEHRDESKFKNFQRTS